jgi:hypothetical protein
MVAIISATRTFFLGGGRVARDGFREAFVDPVPGVPLAADRRVTDRLLVLGELITQEIDGPARFNRAEVAGTVHGEVLDLCGNALAFGGWAPWLGGIVEPCQARGAIRLKPGVHGVRIAVHMLGNVGDAPARSVEYNIVTAFDALGPGMTGLCDSGMFLR